MGFYVWFARVSTLAVYLVFLVWSELTVGLTSLLIFRGVKWVCIVWSIVRSNGSMRRYQISVLLQVILLFENSFAVCVCWSSCLISPLAIWRFQYSKLLVLEADINWWEITWKLNHNLILFLKLLTKCIFSVHYIWHMNRKQTLAVTLWVMIKQWFETFLDLWKRYQESSIVVQ